MSKKRKEWLRNKREKQYKRKCKGDFENRVQKE